MLPSSEPAGAANGYRDRKTGLVVFGILTLLLGLLCALFVPLMWLGQTMAPAGSLGTQWRTILPAMLMYIVLAAIFIWLGIGSILARRWARALLLVFSSTWLVMGVISLGMMIFMFPEISARMRSIQPPAGQPAPPPEMASVILGFTALLLFIAYIVIPGIWTLFYRSRHVKATCEALDPVVRWTDRAPLPVIAVCIWTACTSAAMVLMSVVYRGTIPVFGTIMSGLPGIAVEIVLALIFAYGTWALYKLRWTGWWLLVAIICLAGISAAITYSRHDINELYVAMGYSDQELAQIQKFTIFNGKNLVWVSVSGMLPFLGYMAFLRRYFPRTPT